MLSSKKPLRMKFKPSSWRFLTMNMTNNLHRSRFSVLSIFYDPSVMPGSQHSNFCSGSQNHNVSQICRVKRTKTHINTERLKIKPDLTDLFQPKLFRGPKKGDNYWDSRKVSKVNIQVALYYEAWAFKNEIWVRRLVIVTLEFEIIWKVFESLSYGVW